MHDACRVTAQKTFRRLASDRSEQAVCCVKGGELRRSVRRLHQREPVVLLGLRLLHSRYDVDGRLRRRLLSYDSGKILHGLLHSRRTGQSAS